MNIQLDTAIHERFVSKLLAVHPQIESYISLLLKNSSFVRTRDEFFSYVDSLWKSNLGVSVNPEYLAKIIEVLRLTGLLCRKYYQKSVLGAFLLAYKLEVSSFLRIFQEKLSFIFDRRYTSEISFQDFKLILITCSKWFIQSLQLTPDLTVRRVRVFQEVLCLTFNMLPDSDLLKAAVRPVIMDYLKELRLQFQSKKARFTSLAQLTKEPFSFPTFQQRQRGLVLTKVLIDIYDWMTEYTTPKEMNQSKNYDPPYFDILIHAKKAKVRFEDNKSEEEKVKSVPVSQYTRTVTWILGKEITSREKTFLTTTKNLQSINTLGMNALELINYIREHLMFEYTKIYPNKKRRLLVFRSKSYLVNEWIRQQTRKMDFTCGCCIYLAKYTKIDCLFFIKLEYLTSLGYITIPANLRSLYTERIRPIFSTKVACPFLSLKKAFTIQLKTSKIGKLTCIACQGTINIPSSSEAGTTLSCSCKTRYTVISLKMTEDRVFKCQLVDQHSILPKQDKSDRHIKTLAEQEYKRSDQQEFPENQVLQLQIDNLKLLFSQGPGYIHISEDDSIEYDRKQQLLIINQTSHSLDSLQLVDTEIWRPSLQKLSKSKPSLEFIYRSKNINLSREDKVTLKAEMIPLLQIKRLRKKEIEVYPLPQIQTVYSVGKPRLNKIFKKWGVRTINSSTKGISKEPEEEIKEAMKLPGVQRTLQQLHIQGLMISQMNAVYYLMKLASKYKKHWLVDRYKSNMNKLLPRCPTRLEDYYHESQRKSFRQVSALEAWFSRPFAEGVRKFIIAIQNEKQPLIQRPYGRAVARRVNKTDKQGVDYMGGYTSYDAMLNCVNRRLRHQLRIWNAKKGLGFHTIPLFVHTASDKAGRAGHLDLEEVGRIISQLTLCEAIAEGHIKPFDFQKRFDDDKLPYYVPKEQLVKLLRGEIVKKKIFPKKIYYNARWLSFEVAHKSHVQNLCSCLERISEYSDPNGRIMYLREKYQPLIFQPSFT